MNTKDKFNWVSNILHQTCKCCSDQSGTPSLILMNEILKHDPFAFRMFDDDFFALANWALKACKPSQKKQYADMIAFVRITAETQKNEVAKHIKENEEMYKKVKQWNEARQRT